MSYSTRNESVTNSRVNPRLSAHHLRLARYSLVQDCRTHIRTYVQLWLHESTPLFLQSKGKVTTNRHLSCQIKSVSIWHKNVWTKIFARTLEHEYNYHNSIVHHVKDYHVALNINFNYSLKYQWYYRWRNIGQNHIQSTFWISMDSNYVDSFWDAPKDHIVFENLLLFILNVKSQNYKPMADFLSLWPTIPFVAKTIASF